MTPDETTAELRRLAELATAGPWAVKEGTGWDECYCDWCEVGPLLLPGSTLDANGAYIAAANPSAIIALLDAQAEREAKLRGEVEELKSLVDAPTQHVTETYDLSCQGRLDDWLDYGLEAYAGADDDLRSVMAAAGQLTAAQADNARLREVLRQSAQGWENVIDLDLIPERHVPAATILRDQARAALAKGDA